MRKGFFDRLAVKLDTLKDKGFGAPTQERLNQRLEIAVRNGWVERAGKAVADGADINATFPIRVAEGDRFTGHTPLAAAICLDNHTMTDMLLLFNADPEAKTQSVGHPTALGTAVMQKNMPMVKRLLDAGASAEAEIEELVPANGIVKRFGRTPLLDYARNNKMKKIAKALEEALQKLDPLQDNAPPFTAVDLGAAFRENCCKGTASPIAKPKTARFTRKLSQ